MSAVSLRTAEVYTSGFLGSIAGAGATLTGFKFGGNLLVLELSTKIQTQHISSSQGQCVPCGAVAAFGKQCPL